MGSRGVRVMADKGAKRDSGVSDGQSHARARQQSAEMKRDRVAHIYAMMRDGTWLRGKSCEPLASEWGLAVNTVEHMAAEAWRRLLADVEDPTKVQAEVSAVLMRDISRASAADRFNEVARLGDVLTRVTGARAPERHQDVPPTREEAERIIAEAAAEHERISKAGKK